MTIAELQARTFDALCDADLEQIYQQGKEAMLRDRAFRILLAHADSIPRLEKLAFEGERGLAGWTTEELLEISNRFRLLSSPENEIRLYRQCHDEVFRSAARVREFYMLALNRTGCPSEAIEAALEIIAGGAHNALVWGMLGESYSARMIFAEQLAEALQRTSPEAIQHDPVLAQKLPHHFPDLDITQLPITPVEQLRKENLANADRIFRQGFRETGSSFCGLGWMFRTIDQWVDLVVVFDHLADRASKTKSHLQPTMTTVLAAYDRKLAAQAELVAVALALQGGDESLDYWTHAGLVQLAVIRVDPPDRLQASLDRARATCDAAFKFTITLNELTRLRDQFAKIRDILQRHQHDTRHLEMRLACAEQALAALDAGRTRFANQRPQPNGTARTDDSPLAWMLKKTINFRALTGNLVPLYIEGSIGRVGARVPDLMINRRVREDLIDLLEDKVLRALPVEARDNPLAVIARIQQVVGSELRLDQLQDLQSPAHAAFDARSDGLIVLSGVDRDMRKDTRTSTDLTAALLMQTGDCRETMYLNGALFACWQQMRACKHIATAILCLEFNYQPGFDRIVHEALPALLRYQLRGGQAAVYVESIALTAKYQCRQNAAGIAHLRRYGLDEFQAGQPLTRYELENSRIEVSYGDGSVRWIDPINPATGKWQPIEHIPVDDGGVPVIPDPVGVCAIRLLHLVEDHAMTFLYDSVAQTMTLYDGFYNEKLFASPYPFAQRPIQLAQTQPGAWLHVAERSLVDDQGVLYAKPVYFHFLDFSHTDYAVGLVEGDIPGRLQLMGRTFNADFKLERRRIKEGQSAVPMVLANIQRWQLERSAAVPAERAALDRQLARFMLDLAKDQPELVEFKEVDAHQVLIREGYENDQVYLVLSGQLQVYRNGEPLLGQTGDARVVTAGDVVGEISALRGGPASATVRGRAVLLGISKQVIQTHLNRHPALRASMESLALSRTP